MKMRFWSSILFLFLAISILGACASRKEPGGAQHSTFSKNIADVQEFPQDLNFYASELDAGKNILDAAEQSYLARKFAAKFFAPWQMSCTSISRRDMAAPLRKASGFKYDDIRWTQAEWDEIASNASPSSFPTLARHAITLRNTNLREIPTAIAKFSEPTFDVAINPFDYFQYSLLPPGTPLLVAHTSLDGQWAYVECPVAGGWIQSTDMAFVDEIFKNRWQSGELAALIRDNVNLSGTDAISQDRGGIGTVLPLVRANGKTVDVLVPVRDGKSAYIKEISLDKSVAVKMPFPLTPRNIAGVGNVMLGQSYGWGGMLERRDCSALIRDLFTPFGLWLPRNSRFQARSGVIISLEGLDLKDKEKLILSRGVPFLSLVGMRGHICLYVGKYKCRPAIFHNVWGIRVEEGGNDDARNVIGKAVVTSITPGRELENLYRPITFVDRLRTLTTLGKNN